MRVNLKKIREELAKRCKAGPSSDYQELWLTMNNLLRDFETELRQRLELNNKVRGLLEISELIEEILGEEVSE